MALYTVTKVKKAFYRFESASDCKDFYDLLMEKINWHGTVSLSYVERLLRENFRWKYDSGRESTWSTDDYIPRIQRDDVIYREFSDTYATIYINGYNDEDPKEKTMQDFRSALQEDFLTLLKKWSKENPHLREELKDVTIILTVNNGGVSKPKIFNEVKGE